MSFDPVAYTENLMNSYIKDAAPLEDMIYVKGKVALVVGGSSGLGFCVAQRLCHGGAKVVISGSNEAKGQKAAEMLRAVGHDVSFCKADVRSEAEVEALVAYVDKSYGTLDILVTSNGVWNFGHVYDVSEEEFVRVLDVNLVGTFRCAKHVSRYMIDHGIKGKMVLVSSNAAFRTFPIFGGYASYVASKGGVVALTHELAQELKRYGIMVNTIAPGGMFTPGGVNNGPARGLSEEKAAGIMDELMHMDSGETASADSVALPVYMLCTGVADYITGECLVADNGALKLIYTKQRALEAYPPEAE